MQSKSFVSYALVGLAAAAFSSAATLSSMQLAASANAQTAQAGLTVPLLTQALPNLPGREVRITLLDRPPGNASLQHRHPGHHTFGYVVEGSYELGVDGAPTRMLKAGDTFL